MYVNHLVQDFFLLCFGQPGPLNEGVGDPQCHAWSTCDWYSGGAVRALVGSWWQACMLGHVWLVDCFRPPTHPCFCSLLIGACGLFSAHPPSPLLPPRFGCFVHSMSDSCELISESGALSHCSQLSFDGGRRQRIKQIVWGLRAGIIVKCSVRFFISELEF